MEIQKKYCPGVGLVKDEDLKLVECGFVDDDDDNDDGDDDDDDDDDDDEDDDRSWRRKWGHYQHRF